MWPIYFAGGLIAAYFLQGCDKSEPSPSIDPQVKEPSSSPLDEIKDLMRASRKFDVSFFCANNELDYGSFEDRQPDYCSVNNRLFSGCKNEIDNFEQGVRNDFPELKYRVQCIPVCSRAISSSVVIYTDGMMSYPMVYPEIPSTILGAKCLIEAH